VAFCSLLARLASVLALGIAVVGVAGGTAIVAAGSMVAAGTGTEAAGLAGVPVETEVPDLMVAA
jgi:hypothetical protein